MTKTTAILAGATFALMLVCFTALSIVGRDTGQLAQFLTTTVVPAVLLLANYNKADKAKQNSEVAAANTEKIVHQTNGRMTELIQTIQAMGGTVPPGYEDVTGGVPK